MSLLDQTAQEMLGDLPGGLTLRALREHSDCLALLNEEARIVALSSRGLEALDLTEDEARGTSWWELWPDHARETLRAAFERGLNGQITTYCLKAAMGDEEPLNWDIRVTPVSNGTAQTSAVLVICQEVDQCD